MSSLLSYSLLPAHLRQASICADAIAAPSRHHHTFPCSSSSSVSSALSTHLVMPATWPLIPSSSSSYMGVKLFSVFPHNSSAGLPSICLVNSRRRMGDWLSRTGVQRLVDSRRRVGACVSRTGSSLEEDRAAFVVVDAAQMSSLLSYSVLTAHLRQAFVCADAIAMPTRHHHTIPCSSSSSATSSALSTLLVMPAWPLNPSSSSSYMGVKLVSVFPRNSSAGLPSISASYLLSSALTGLPLAFLDGKELTLWRTACVSALAAQYLARPDAKFLLMLGAGDLAPHLIRAHCVMHPSIETIVIWNRTYSKAELLSQTLQSEKNASEEWNGLPHKTIYACRDEDLEKVARMADIISCATLSEKALVRGSWLRSGTHLDLVGSFTPNMKECDEDAIKKGRLFVDTPAALEEAGELQDLAAGALQGTLTQLAKGEVQGRLNSQDITVFKSVGCALVDLAAGQLVYERLQRNG